MGFKIIEIEFDIISCLKFSINYESFSLMKSTLHYNCSIKRSQELT
ncbi:hypothetical protein MtrunA17_Chr3g0133591 [Medicago truncatula]|uniref:Uncharacterized protein n=1 Tax=Medicago truncatula TaxID=3880 RepID=A0A396J4U6_MEDTR|nr:hypothetical protein MtrunA17_Chr3g0133591 [Medicago truncatula]